jgi:hypothetical protein
MLGLIVKIFGFIAAIIFAVLLILNVTNVWNPGTLSLSTPSVEPCQRYAQQFFKSPPHLIEVRWIMTSKDYGWGCFFEYDISTTQTLTPMPQ